MSIALPPQHFDHPYSGPVIEYVIPDVDAKCRQAHTIGAEGSQIILGCSFKLGQSCFIFLKEGHPLLEQLRRHEIGHCNGWNKDHNN